MSLRLPRVAIAAVALVAGLAAPAACLSPTEITVRVETDMTCGSADGDLEKVLIGTGGGQSATVSLSAPCQDGFVGSITIVPGKSADTVDIDVVGRLQGAKCDLTSANGDGCVVAKRRLSFIDHIPLTITVRLDSDCAGVECPNNQTCQAGVCVDPQCTSSSCADGGDGGTTPRASILVAGGDATCASDGNGNWVCWGDSTGGKLFRTGTIPPTLIPELQGAKRVVLGRAHGCAVFADDAVKCWGANDRFQAGAPSGATVALPSPVMDGNGSPVTAPTYLAAGDDFTCAAVDGGPVLARSIVECWGAGDVGQLGPNAQGTPKATLVKGVTIGKEAPANALAAGANHACAIANLTNGLCTGGSQCGVVCWGLNKDGQCSTPGDSPALPRLVSTSARGVYAGGDRSLVKRASLVDLNASELWAWGKGVGTIPSTATPTKVGLFGLVVAASAGTDHACVLDGIRPSCLANDPSYMGAFTTTVPNATAFGALVSGWNHTCALTVKSGQIWCWGKNDKLQLGSDKATSPHKVTLPQ